MTVLDHPRLSDSAWSYSCSGHRPSSFGKRESKPQIQDGWTGTYSCSPIPASLRGAGCEMNNGVMSMASRPGTETLDVSGAYRIDQTRLLVVLFLLEVIFDRICRALGNGRVPCAETCDLARRDRGDGCGDHAWVMGYAFVSVSTEEVQAGNGLWVRILAADCAVPSSDGNRLRTPEGPEFCPP